MSPRQNPSSTHARRKTIARACAIAALAMAAYLPSLRAGYIWDDDKYVKLNREVLDPRGLDDIWFKTRFEQYYPVTMTSFWLESRLYLALDTAKTRSPEGLDVLSDGWATGFHLVNMLLHALAAVVLWRVLLRLKVPGAWLGAAIFAVHPVGVASVAWISERKNMLSLLLAMLSLLAFLRFDERRRWWLYAAALAAFAAGLLSKTAVAPLPLVMLLCLWWLRGRIRVGDVLRVVPFLALAAGLGVVTVLFEHRGGPGGGSLAGRALGAINWPDAPALCGAAAWFYLYKAVWPTGLMMIYPKWQINAAGAAWYLPTAAAAAAGAALWRQRRRAWVKPLAFALGVYVVMLLPALGFVRIQYMQHSFVSDHWQYVALPAIAALAAAAWRTVTLKRAKLAENYEWVAIIAIVVLGGLTLRHCARYANQDELFQHNLANNPRAWNAHQIMGISLVTRSLKFADKGDQAEADRLWAEGMAHFNEALKLNDRVRSALADAYSMAGRRLFAKGRFAESVEPYRQAVRWNPDSAQLHCNLATALVGAAPDQADPKAYLAEAVEQLRQAIAIKPEWDKPYYEMGNAMMGLAKAKSDPLHLDDAATAYRTALEHNPQNAQARYNLASLYRYLDRPRQALGLVLEGLELMPENAQAHMLCGELYAALGDKAKAVECLRAAIRYDDRLVRALLVLARLQATSHEEDIRNGPEAVKWATRARDVLGREDVEVLDVLAAAHAAAGQFREAVICTRQAWRLAVEQNKPEWARHCERRLNFYANGVPIRE